ncbi:MULTISPECIES: hypothetical protein [unclassified Mesorhizobium]|uniref:hypothetical protein n=1 Tax=unclassified Mesorhizobium TaxID=325217 RepID=UPI001128985C|nr:MULTISPECIES: hypothetical protein [unclassified Mesorhizobium]TPK42655.1 hypothetical protein FJ550_29815 [Mesorhizobium sp. B2-5-2]TPL26775.1 hypothetical protein FJ946_13135 [Mesorhizobium sp. B2-4-7]TPL40553.1 hypothetical protein FJ961_17435 [Mesorhizobium sp. B2-4-5]TPM76827.1 hypothetical protein FJ968_03665 [Mesorhizobium sp. B2-1-6]TPN72490.1 hypothetical protein FJ985_29320 [Mesorhizobium sp. B1-1-2]
MTDGEKEKIKLRATYFNGIAIALMAVGGIGPYVTLSQLLRGTEAMEFLNVAGTLFFACGFVWISLKLHERAAGVLGELDK